MDQQCKKIRTKMESVLFLFLIVTSTGLINGSCPSVCHCGGAYIECNSRSLGNIPSGLPDNTLQLRLENNKIKEIDIQFCKQMLYLKYIHLHINQISEIPVNTFVDCGDQVHTIVVNSTHTYRHNRYQMTNNRTKGSLGSNLIEYIHAETFRNLTTMQILSLKHNKISTIEPFTFTNLISLRYIHLHSNKIRSLENNTFVNMRDLGYIYLNENDISRIESSTFVNTPTASVINLSSNKIQSIKSYTFSNMSNLNNLDLTGNNISFIEENAFGNSTSIYVLLLTSNPLNCDCSIYPFWSWLIERATIGSSAKCNNGTYVITLRPVELEKCNPNSCQCFNGGTCVTRDDGLVVCDCIGQWTGEFCQESQCISHDCGLGNCYVEPFNGTAQCICDDTLINLCLGMQCYV